MPAQTAPPEVVQNQLLKRIEVHSGGTHLYIIYDEGDKLWYITEYSNKVNNVTHPTGADSVKAALNVASDLLVQNPAPRPATSISHYHNRDANPASIPSAFNPTEVA